MCALRLSCQRNVIAAASSLLTSASAAFAIRAPASVVRRSYLCGRDRSRLTANFAGIIATPAALSESKIKKRNNTKNRRKLKKSTTKTNKKIKKEKKNC